MNSRYSLREIFTNAINSNFKEIDQFYELFDFEGTETSSFKLWKYDSDEYYILNKRTFEVIYFYKHLGRAIEITVGLNVPTFVLKLRDELLEEGVIE